MFDILSGSGLPRDEPDVAICSAKGCRRPAKHAIRWNNPKLHTPERRKIWLACDEHLDSLRDFLALRGFVKDVVPLDELNRDIDGDDHTR